MLGEWEKLLPKKTHTFSKISFSYFSIIQINLTVSSYMTVIHWQFSTSLLLKMTFFDTKFRLLVRVFENAIETLKKSYIQDKVTSKNRLVLCYVILVLLWRSNSIERGRLLSQWVWPIKENRCGLSMLFYHVKTLLTLGSIASTREIPSHPKNELEITAHQLQLSLKIYF